jgi:hypothetical protein
MAVDMKDRRLVLLCASCNQQVGDRQAMQPPISQFAVGGDSDPDRLDVDSQLVERLEVALETSVVVRRSSAAQHLQPGDRTDAGLAQVGVGNLLRSHQRGLVDQQPALGRWLRG